MVITGLSCKHFGYGVYLLSGCHLCSWLALWHGGGGGGGGGVRVCVGVSVGRIG